MRELIPFGMAILLFGPVMAPSLAQGEDGWVPTMEKVDGTLGSLGGYVREGDPDQGVEIEGAVVTLSNGLVAFTNGRGYFEFQGIEAGWYVISVEAECYEPNAVDAYVEPDTLNIQNVGLEPIPGCVPEESGCGAPARWAGEPGGPASGLATGGLLLAGVLGLRLRVRRQRR